MSPNGLIGTYHCLDHQILGANTVTDENRAQLHAMVQALRDPSSNEDNVVKIVDWMRQFQNLIPYSICQNENLFVKSYIPQMNCVCLKGVDKTHQAFLQTLQSLGFKIYPVTHAKIAIAIKH